VRRLLLLVLLAVVAGCSLGDDAGPLRADALPGLVLLPSDLPPDYVRFDQGDQGKADSSPREIVDPVRFGRLGGWKARYRLPSGSKAAGPAVIDSRADVFEAEDGAAEDLEQLREGLKTGFGGGVETLRSPELGDDSVAATLEQGSGRFATRFYFFAWRHANATAFLTVNGQGSALKAADARRLAGIQAARIAAAIEKNS